jgi:RNA polymerase sigma factor (sigma-70 family)
MNPEDAEFAAFLGRQYSILVKFLIRRGASLSDAEDVVQTVFTRMLALRTKVDDPRAYLYQAVKNEVATLARRRRGELDAALRWAGSQVDHSAVEDVYHQREVGIVRDSLTMLPRRQREVMAKSYEGYPTNEIAEVLGMSRSTVTSTRRHGRETLQPFLAGDGQELNWRAGLQVWDAWHRGDPLPAAPRPVISGAWVLAKALGVDPERGTAVVPLGGDEVKRRRRESPLAACSWALDALAELAKISRQMMVVVDAEGVVLWRGGDREVLRRADALGFVEGACWHIKNAGANGIALALITGRTVKVCGWEHYVQAQHNLSCAAAPVHDPQDGRVLCVLNLTGTGRTVHRSILREIDTLAIRLHRQLRTLCTPSASLS